MFSFRRQPLKTVYLLYAFVTVPFIRLPYWLLLSSIPAFRPCATWSMKRTVLFWLVKAFTKMMYAVGLPAAASNPSVDSAHAEETGFAWVDAVPTTFLVGDIEDMARKNAVAPVQMFGYWYRSGDAVDRKDRRAGAGEKVLYYLHGGGYVMGSAHPKSMAINIPRGVLEASGGMVLRAFCLEYRTAQSDPYVPANPFPAPLIDALSGYHYLVETLGFEPKNIILSGDSAGGHLAVVLTRYLVVGAFSSLATPGALLAFSPTLDWGNTHLGTPGSTMFAHDASDFVREVLMNGYSAASIRGVLDARELATNAWLSPASLQLAQPVGLFTGFPPTCVIAGAAEQTVDGMRTFRDRLAHDSGEDAVTYIEYPDAFHDFVVITWAEPERSNALADIKKWLGTVYTE